MSLLEPHDKTPQEVLELERRCVDLEIKLRAADEMARVCDDWVTRGLIDARSALADARLDYGEPFTYGFSKKKGTKE